MAGFLIKPLRNWLARLRHPQLFVLMLVLFVIDLVVPDPLFLVDELLLATATLWFGMWRKQRTERKNSKA